MFQRFVFGTVHVAFLCQDCAFVVFLLRFDVFDFFSPLSACMGYSELGIFLFESFLGQFFFFSFSLYVFSLSMKMNVLYFT